ncbi:MAG: hypothetical protein ABI591_21040 [Kofleriaceae bacterium]
MPADDQGGARPAPVVLRIKLRYDDVETMVQRFAPNVGKSGLFLPTRSLQPIGTEIKFELRIANDTPVLVGLGRVKAAKPPDPANPKASFGLAIELMRVTREGREVIIRMIERRRAMGLADVAIPMPEDVETAKRADVETQPRAEAAAIVAPAPKDHDSVPILSAPPPVTTPLARATTKSSAKPAAKPEPEAKQPPAPIVPAKPASTAPDASFTSARSSVRSSPAVRSDRSSAPALAPEVVRAKRPRLADLLAQVERSGPVGATTELPELDQHVDLERAMARARTLAGGNDLDAELSALRESAAAPLAEITIEAASAELARQLGGVSVGKRMRVPALGTVEAATVPPIEPAPPRSAEPRLASSSSEMLVAELPVGEPVVEPVLAGASVGIPVAIEEPTPVVDAPPVVDEEPPRELTRPATSSAEMDQLAAEAAAAIAARADEPRPRTKTAPPAMIVEDDAELMSFERALEAARIHTGVATSAVPEADHDIAELDPDEIEELPGENTQVGQHPDARVGLAAPVSLLADSLDRQLDDADADHAELARSIQEAASAYEAELAQVPEAEAQSDDFDEEEISDLDVLAEADADDADLMAAHGERESEDEAPAYAPPADPYAHEHPAAPELEASSAYAAHDPAAFAEQDRAYAAAQAAQAPVASTHGYTGPQEYTPPPSDYAQDPATYAADPDAYAAYANQRAASVAPADDPYAIDTAYTEQPAYEPQAVYTAQEDRGYDSRGRAAAPDLASYEDPQRAYDPAYAEEAEYAEQVAREAGPYEHDLDPVTRPGEVPLPPATYGNRVPRRAATPEDEEFDFAAQLDLDDESGTRPPAPYSGGYDIPSEYTFAEKLPTREPSFAEQEFPETPGLDEALEFDEPHQFATNTPAPPVPRSPAGTRQRPPSHQRMASRARSEDPLDFDDPHSFSGGGAEQSLDSLESALSTLDVDLDHLEVPPPQRTRQPRAERASDRGSRPLPGMPPERSPLDPPTVVPAADDRRSRPTGRNVVAKPAAKRPTAAPPVPANKPIPRAASEDDGVLIDFDDDE